MTSTAPTLTEDQSQNLPPSGQITLTHACRQPDLHNDTTTTSGSSSGCDEDVDEQAQALADERAEAAAQRDAADAATAAAVGAATLARRDFLRQRIRSTDAALAGLLIERGLFTLEEYRKERDHFIEQAARTAKDPALAAETALWRALAADVDEYLGRSPVEAQAGLWDETRGSPG